MAVVKRLIIADAHVGQRSRDASDMILILLSARDLGVTEVIYLGDAFQYLIGMSKFWTAGVTEVMAVWRRLRREGMRIGVIEGNRDFFLDAPELAAEIDFSGLEAEFVAGSRRFRLVHGDKVNLRDLQYRFWSTVSKSRPARVWARLLPRPLAVGIVRTMEARLAETNRRFRYHKPVASLRRTAEKAWSQGIDVLLWGHFHTHWAYVRDDHAAVILPAWLDTGRSLLIDCDGRTVMVEKNLTPCGPLHRMDRCTGSNRM
jgi:UDP-2,3-diacylglucosamine pyrophosphatase LpxH